MVQPSIDGRFGCVGAPSLNAQGETTRMAKKALGLNKIIAFYGAYPELKSQTFARGSDWKYWNKRGGIVSRGWSTKRF